VGWAADFFQAKRDLLAGLLRARVSSRCPRPEHNFQLVDYGALSASGTSISPRLIREAKVAPPVVALLCGCAADDIAPAVHRQRDETLEAAAGRLRSSHRD